MPARNSFNLPMLRIPNTAHRLCQHHLFSRQSPPQKMKEFSVGNTAAQMPGSAGKNSWEN